MKKLTKVVASLLALSCINLVGCGDGEDTSLTVTLKFGDEVLDTIDVNKDSELKAPQAYAKEGYTFVGWFVDAECTTAYNPTSVSENLTLYAKYEKKNLFITLDLNGGSLQEGVSNRVTVKHNETYSLPVPSRLNYSFEGWVIENDDGTTADFPASGTYARTSGCFLTAKWEKLGEDTEEDTSQALFMKAKDGAYFKERESVEDEFTYVFVTGMEYNFNTLKGLGIVGANASSIKQEGTKFTANKADKFTLRITKEVDGAEVQYDRQAKIVDQVETFDGGADFLTSWGKGVDRSKNFQDTSKTVEATAMSVGRNNYIPDLAMFNDKDVALSMEEANVVLTVTDDGVATEDYTVVDGVVTFGASVESGSQVTVTYAPKYSLTNQTLTVKLKVNDGVNVYDNEQLRTAYKDDAVSEVNILRNVKATVAPEDMVPGHNVPINEYTRAVYARNIQSTDDVITVNGNFFKIDGSDLPLMNNDIGGQDWQDSNMAWYVPNMQLGIFQYMNVTAGDGDDAEYIHTGKATFNDLYITGNYTKADNHTIKYGDKDLLTQSGSYQGIVLRGGQATVNNTTIVNTNIALFTGSNYSHIDPMQQASKWDVNYARLTHSWGNQVYMYRASVFDIENSYLGDCGGAAIHLDDAAYDKETETTIESVLKMDANTKVENFIVGDSAYFKARGMDGLAIQTKTQIEDKVNPGGQGLCTVIKKRYDASLDKDVDTFNLIFLVRSTNSETSDWAKDQTGYPTIDYTALYTGGLLSNGMISGYLPFGSVDNPSPTTAEKYMFGFVEAMSK